MKEIGLTDEEVEGWREVFFSFDEESRGVLGFAEIRKLLRVAGLILDSESAMKLREMMLDLEEDEDNTTTSFTEFLHLIKRLADMNFSGIREKAQHILKRNEEEKRKLIIHQQNLKILEEQRQVRRQSMKNSAVNRRLTL